MSQTHEEIFQHVHKLQVELRRIKLIIQRFPPREPCRDELEEIYESISTILATLNADLLHFT
jgi:hypothetical protein